MVEFRVFRFEPEDGEPKFDRFQVPVEKGMTVLEGLYYILENLDGSLAFRSSCRSAVCGSCAMHINGCYRLACRTQVAALEPPIIIRPLAHLSILRDLVVDMEPFFAHYEVIKPYLVPKEPPPEREYLQSQKERRRLDGLVDCILCGACYGACPLGLSDPHYLGPHAFLQALRFLEDSRDGAEKERLALIGTEDGAFRCHTVFSCQRVCPKDLDPSGAIARLKLQFALSKLRRMFRRP